ncbi:hypothetical protein MCOR18_008646 [Pyricularia oryzae]|nr:hypothetical protein MCOR18_008646 [Pyricularia oryzae]KAI6556504.1 hypothetical protein MCOR09_009674 [Pyricularia oryzae]
MLAAANGAQYSTEPSLNQRVGWSTIMAVVKVKSPQTPTTFLCSESKVYHIQSTWQNSIPVMIQVMFPSDPSTHHRHARYMKFEEA